jgi:hypothetical protein
MNGKEFEGSCLIEVLSRLLSGDTEENHKSLSIASLAVEIRNGHPPSTRLERCRCISVLVLTVFVDPVINLHGGNGREFLFYLNGN